MRKIKHAILLLAIAIIAFSARADMGELLQAANLINAAEVAELIAKAGTDQDGHPRIQAVPMLKVTYACGEDCAPGEAIRLLIESAYREAAKQAGLGIRKENPALLTITSYYARNNYVRGFLGFMAGADNIRGELTMGGQSWKVGDASISKFSGIDSVARAVGAESFKMLLTDASSHAMTQSAGTAANMKQAVLNADKAN